MSEREPITNQPRNQYGLNPLEAADEVHETQTKVRKKMSNMPSTIQPRIENALEFNFEAIPQL